METINEKELREFLENIKGLFCVFEGCDKGAEGYIRTHPVCKKHFKKIRQDNKKRIRRNIDITDSLSILKRGR